MGEQKTVLIPISNVKPGMVVARDIYSRNEKLLIPKGTVLDENGIAKITFFGILSISVFVENEDLIDDLDGEIIDKQEEEDAFQEFGEIYQESIVSVTHTMNSLLESGNEIDEDKLIHEVDHIVAVTNNRYQVFDMLKYLKQYDDETYMHCVNVSMLCNVFADWLGMSELEKKQLTLCGLLHDFGKLLINKEVLRKPGALTEEEYKIIKEHPIRGYEFFKNKKMNESVKRAVLLHHERCDGKGYPFGLKISEIDPYAAITAIADVYEAMTANRVYRRGICPFEVIRLFEEEGKQQFNPIFLVPILQRIADTYAQKEVILSDGKKGKIILINTNELHRPSVLTSSGMIDLSKQRNLSIIEVL